MATVPVMQYGNIKSYEAFVEDHMDGEEANLPVYLKGLSTILGLDYYQSSPLYYFDDEGHEDVSFKLGIYHVGATDGKDLLSGFLIYLYDVEIKDELDEVIEKPIIKLTVTFDQATQKSGDEYVNFASTIFYPDNTLSIPFLYMFDIEDELKLKDEDVYANINRIAIEYSNGDKDDDGKYVYNDNFLFLAVDQATNDEPSHVTELGFLLTSAEYRVRQQFNEPIPTEDEMVTFGLVDDKFSLQPYNWIIWRTLIIYALIIMVISYFLFFHKKIMEKRKFRKLDESIANPRTVDAEPIFKDSDQNQKDGK
jgi:hypothetical protein